MTHHDIIKAMGGPIALGRELGVDRPAVALHWHSRGIPARFWHRVVDLAKHRGISVTFDLLESGKPRRQPAVEAA